MRPPSHQPRPHPPTATPIRHSCAGRKPRDHHPINHARTLRRPPRSVIPAQAGIHATTIPSTTPAPSDGPPNPHSCATPIRHSYAPSVIPAQAGIHATTMPSTTPAPSDRHPDPSFLRPLHHSRAPLRHSCAPSVIPAQAGIHATTIASITPAPSDGPPNPQSARFLPVAVEPLPLHRSATLPPT